jgi:hypothetical protein
MNTTAIAPAASSHTALAITAAPAPLALATGTKHDTREGWLREAIERLAPLFAAHGVVLPTVQVSVGWPGGPGRKNDVIGQCWHKGAAEDRVAHIFISPVLSDPAKVLATLVHELVHAWDENRSGHRGAFAKTAKAVGLEGKMTATVAGAPLAAHLDRIAEGLGVYPHGAVAKLDRPTGKGRMIKMWCEECGFITYTTRKWIDAYFEWPCPCGAGVVSEVW